MYRIGYVILLNPTVHEAKYDTKHYAPNFFPSSLCVTSAAVAHIQASGSRIRSLATNPFHVLKSSGPYVYLAG